MSVHDLMLIIVFLPNVVIASISMCPTTLTTTLGDVTGVKKPAGNNAMVEIFYSIPFAKPPVGDLRFKHPLPAEPWVGVRDGTKKPNSCWQAIDTTFEQFPGVEMWNPNTPRSEDCLYLNVWRPVSADIKPKSILVWIYGGGFFSGTTTLDLYDATQLSVRNDVIVVSIAYRLGSLGFLYLGNDDAPGNAGLMDQSLALKWIKDNVVNLGGSADSITIFGESAGAASVGFHLLSPVSRNHFNYAILESASPLAIWAINDNVTALHTALTFASAVSCSTNNISASINCLRSVDPQTLCDKQSCMQTALSFPFNPVIDGYFLPDHPLKMAQRGDIKNTSVLLGVNKNEGISFNIYDFQKDFPLKGDGHISEDRFNIILSQYFNHDQRTSDLIKREYMKNSNTSYTEILDAITGDKYFKCPVVNFASLLSQNGANVFLYSFEHRVSTNPWPEWTGVVHGYEIELVFGLPLETKSVYTDEEKALSLQMMHLWTNFAKTGNPNSNSSIEWPEYTTDSKDYIVIDTACLTRSHGLQESQCAFLDNVTNPLQRTELTKNTTPSLETSTVADDASTIRHAFTSFSQ